jgi:hypothetical protein
MTVFEMKVVLRSLAANVLHEQPSVAASS